MITKPKGCHDIYGMEAKKWKYISNLIDAVCERYNYEFIRTPIFEASELYHRGVGETSDIVTKETYDFTDRGERKMTLRPEGTAGVVRSYIENKMYGDAKQPIKLYYNGTMYRYERPQSGRDRELTQFGVEVLGSDDPMIDAEVISIAVNIYKMVGLKGIKVNINSLGDKESRDNYRKILIEYFTPYINEMCDDCKNRLEKNPLRILDCKVDGDSDIMKKAPKITDYLNDASRERFERVQKYLDLLDIDYVVNPSIVRGLDYYDHTVFEVEASVEGFGSQNVLCGGGRYDNLVENIGGPSTKGVGFAMGMERLLTALEYENINLIDNDCIDVYVIPMDESVQDKVSSLVMSLRLNGFKVDMDYMKRNLKSNFKQADRLNAKYIIIVGEDEIKSNTLTLKNNKTKEEYKIKLDDLVEFLDKGE